MPEADTAAPAAVTEPAALAPAARAALRQLLLALADDELVIGHRNSEWTGLGPILEEDIAFSSIAQDELGHALSCYTLLEQLGAGVPDQLAFAREAAEFRNATLLEAPRGDYAFSLMRQLLYDVAEAVRLESLAGSAYAPLAQVARKIRPEERYHLMHAVSYTRKLAHGGAEALDRLQTALDAAYPGALGLFEPVAGEAALVAAGIAEPSAALQARWQAALADLLRETGLTLPATAEAGTGGRQGRHTPELAALLAAMQTVYRSDPRATW